MTCRITTRPSSPRHRHRTYLDAPAPSPTLPAMQSPPIASLPAPFPTPADADRCDSDSQEAISQSFTTAAPSDLSCLESGPDLSALMGLSHRHSFIYALSELRDKLDAVLEYKDDPDELEYHAILFWPFIGRLRPWLGKGRRESELITHLDIVRAQFRTHPVTAEVMIAVRELLHRAATAPALTIELVDECLDLLEEAGVDLRFPLAFERPHED